MRTVGVEEELMLFTPSAQPAPVGAELAEDPSTGVEHEFKLEQAEIASAPQRDLDALTVDLHARRAELAKAAADRGVLAAGLATSPSAILPTATPDERYRRMHEQYGLVAGDQLTCGTHVHVSVASRAEGIAAIDGVREWVALLLALSGNSPFWTGLDTGYASYRTIAWGRWPTAGPTAAFGNDAAYDRRVHEAVTTGAAVDSGMIYFDVRLSAKYPTVEFRMADVGQQVADSVLLAALCRAAVETAVREPGFDAPVARLRSAAWRAARFGLSEQLVDVADASLRPAEALIARMVEALAPALEATGDRQRVADLISGLWKRGVGAQVQRADLLATGSVLGVVRAAAGRLSV
ncbi:MAG TPA: glutamate--cysteine ligase [Jatrophihabitans sp.]|jgi:carboxylate-amine ligase